MKIEYSGKNRTGRLVRSLRVCPWPGIRPSDANNSENSLSMRLANATLSSAMRRQFQKDRSALRRKRRRAASSVPLTKPSRLAFFHVGLRFLGIKEQVAAKLPESPLDDFIRVLVGTRLDRLGDQFFMLRSKGDRHTHLPAIVATSAYHGNAWDFPAGMASEKSGSWRTRADLEVCPTRSDQ